ncbi:hypothetical protein HYH02_011616 [Chlamydomonas schloesseri]|uniref:phosphatidylinositol-3,4,5-trisphosphate 3-phosphatase n=1 Tax=Chlamydomonas schloesseri TaxID=2026947 RepID=A0A835W538_9CHLO|nr:hypothetical protein HYH02_011616 [Chlamydomonas schloesseri]|eukprot:KAG2436106.1 hypothetical protein HYH02_011616 [Chlamydomonas schloesseri]
MAFVARRLVSTNKRRYQEDGYDLDLTYITPRIIAMGFPCDGFSSLYRNPAGQVAALLESRHGGGRYRVYNLCVERGYGDPGLFGGRVVRLPMYDGQAPPLPLLVALCRDCRDWLGAHPGHVVALHCKAGKGRTGAAVCALLLALDPALGPHSLDATLAFWAQQRTRDGKGLTIPSQRRSVEQFHRLLMSALAASDPQRGPALAPLALPHAAAGGGASSGQAPAAQRPGAGSSAAPGATAGADVGAAAADTTAATATAAAAVAVALDAVELPHAGVVLRRLVVRGLPEPLLRRCTVAVWWRPSGHYEARPLCCVHTSTTGTGSSSSSSSSTTTTGAAAGGEDACGGGGSAGCLGGVSGGGPGAGGCQGSGTGGATWALAGAGAGGAGAGQSSGGVAPDAGISSSSGARGSSTRGVELIVDLTSVPSPPPPPAPTPLPYFQPAEPPPHPPPPSRPGVTSSHPAAVHTGASAAGNSNGTHGHSNGAGRGAGSSAAPGAGGSSSSRGSSGGPLLAGDIKLQLFKGRVVDPAPDIFKGRASQFSAWLHTACLHDHPHQLGTQQTQSTVGPTGPHLSEQEAGAQPRWAQGAHHQQQQGAPGAGCCTLSLTGAQLDKLAKPLRKRRSDISVLVEYELH